MSILQIGAGAAYIMDFTQSPPQRIVVGSLKGGKFGFKNKLEFESGSKVVNMYAALLGMQMTGELNFKALDLALMKAVGLAQISGGNGLSRISVLGDLRTAVASLALTGSVDVYSIRDMVTGEFFKKVASAPAAGQYSFSAGTVAFAAADVSANKQVSIDWQKNAATENNKLILTNAVQQQAQYFGVEGIGQFDGKQVYYNLPRSVATDFPDLFSAGDKFADRKLPFEALANPITDYIGEISLTETLT